MTNRATVTALLAALDAEIARSGESTPADGAILTSLVLTRILRAGPGSDRDALEHICRQIDVRRRLSERYRPDWKAVGTEIAASPATVAAAAAALLAEGVHIERPTDAATGALHDGWGLKCTNSALKALEFQPGLPEAPALRQWAEANLASVDISRRRTPEPTGCQPHPGPDGTTRVVPITVLAWEGPQARAYLVRMRRAGLRAERVLLMVRDPKAVRGKPGSAMRIARRPRRAERFQDRAANFHPYAIRKQHRPLVDAIATAMDPIIGDAAGCFEEMFSGFSYDRYADRVERVMVSSYRDPRLVQMLSEHAVATALFTGGGIIPAPVFAVPGLRIVHVHTGFLPHVRGADVLLWSMLVRGVPGVSAFVMSPGLDDGDVLAARELAPLTVRLPVGSYDDDTLYRALFSFIDPLVRAELLVAEVLGTRGGIDATEPTPQDVDTGITYHFLHPALRHLALQMLFRSAHDDN